MHGGTPMSDDQKTARQVLEEGGVIGAYPTKPDEPTKTLWLVMEADGKVRAYQTKPERTYGMELAVTYVGEILGVTHGGFYSVSITDEKASS